MITIFTPTYNRAYIIHKLFESLQIQTNKDFEWLIVDDGSTDNTANIVEQFKTEANFPIRYYFKVNGGKHRAINYGVPIANGELFFIVDSDDYLSPDAVDRLSHYYQEIKNNDCIAGVCGLRKYPDGRINGLRKEFNVLDATTAEISKYLTCDKAEAYKTEILKHYPFPEFDGEKFISEGVVWNKISKEYKVRYFFEPIYICEYLEDGLTRNVVRQHRNSPLGTLLTFKVSFENATTISKRIKAILNYYRYSLSVQNIPENLNLPFWTKPLAPLGYLLNLKDSITL